MEALKLFVNEWYHLLMLGLIMVLGIAIWATLIKIHGDLNDWMMGIIENTRSMCNETEIIKSYTINTHENVVSIKNFCDDSAESLYRINKKLKKKSKEGTPDA